MSHARFDFGDGAIEFDEEKATAHRIVGMDSGFGGLDGERVHDFNGSGENGRGNDAAEGGARFIGGREGGEEHADAFGALDETENDFGGDAQSAFGADEDAEKVVAGRVERLAAEMNEGAVGKDNFEAEDVRGGESVLEAVRAAGIFGDVAANGADGLRRRIGSVEIILRGDATGD